MPEETAEVRAVYVSDMGRAKSWDDPGAENWIDAEKAFFVIGAAVQGGMGAPEAVPFADRAAAEAWRAEHGGRIATLDEIPDDYVLAPVDVAKMLGMSEETQE